MPPAKQSPVGVDLGFNRSFLASSADRPKLRIGVLADTLSLPAYARAVLEDIAKCNYADVACVVVNATKLAPPAPAKSSGLLSPLRRLFTPTGWNSIAFDGYRRLVDSNRAPMPDPLEFAPCDNLVRDAVMVPATPVSKGFVDRFEPGDVQRLRELKLDVVLRFGFRIVRGEILKVARHGVWSFHHGDSEHYRGGPAHFWELVEESPVSGVVMQVLSEELDAGAVLAKGLFATVDSPSMSENRFVPYWSAEHFVIRTLHELHSLGDEAFSSRLPSPPPYVGRRKIYRVPTNPELATWLLPRLAVRGMRRLGRLAGRGLHQGSGESVWKLGVRRGATRLYDDTAPDALRSFTWLSKPSNGFWADPFLIRAGGRYWLFYEDWAASHRKGVIAVAELGADGTLGAATTALDQPFHLSYPHVFESDGTYFMVPESQQSGRVDLYRAVDFPHQWVFETTLLDFRAVDSSPFFDQGRWWMTSSPRPVPGSASLTYVWTADRLLGPWTLASHQPLSCDVRTARGAGRIFRDGDRLIRPSQDGSLRYGRAIAFSEIERLDGIPRESRFKLVEPNGISGMTGIHTYNAIDAWEVVDGLFKS